MLTLVRVEKDDPHFIPPPDESVEHVYSAKIVNCDGMKQTRSVVCYRTKDGLTHLSECIAGVYSKMHTVKPFGK